MKKIMSNIKWVLWALLSLFIVFVYGDVDKYDEDSVYAIFKSTSCLSVPCNSHVKIYSINNGKASFIYKDMWYGNYDLSLFQMIQ